MTTKPDSVVAIRSVVNIDVTTDVYIIVGSILYIRIYLLPLPLPATHHNVDAQRSLYLVS